MKKDMTPKTDNKAVKSEGSGTGGTTDYNKILTLKEKISYGMGDFGNGFMFDLGQAYLLKFYTDVCGIAGAAAGGVFLFTKIFDAFMDPVAGTFVDKRKVGKNGKFKPVMMIASIILAVLTVVTFLSPNVSTGGKLIYAYASYMLWGVCYSFTNVPYGSLGSVLTQDVNQRTQLASFRQAGSLGALLITGVIFVPLLTLFPNAKVGYPVLVGLMSLVGVVAFFMCYKNTKEIVEPKKREKITARSMANAVFSNKPLLTLILMTVFSISAYNIKTAMLIYYCQYNLGNVKLMANVNFVIIGCSVIGITAIPKLVKIFGKKQTAMLGFGVSVIADTINFLLPTNVYTFTILASIAFVGISIPNGITWAFVSDVIDYGEWRTGVRSEGIIYSAFNFSRKIAQSLAGFAAGFGLTFIGYIPKVKQTQRALNGIKGLLMLYPAIALVFAVLVIGILYGLSDKKYKEIIADLKIGKFSPKANVK